MKTRKREHEELPWASFSDALSGMLFVFVLTTFWFAFQLAQATKEQRAATQALTQADERARDLVATLDDNDNERPGKLTDCLTNGADGSPIEKAEWERQSARVSLYLPSAVEWFPSCSADLGADQRRAADRVRACIDRVLIPELDTYNVRVFLEGHTDALPVRGCGLALPSNWELSAARAATVTRAVLCEGDDQRICTDREIAIRLAKQVAESKLQVLPVGMADTKPAWRAICGMMPLTSSDKAVCEALNADPSFGPASLMVLQREVAGGVLSANCSTALPAMDDEGRSNVARLLTRWANQCPQGSTARDLEKGRLGRLRRVDLRIEVEARLLEDRPPEAQDD